MYIGPETLMPLASILAAVSGIIMMFWRRVTALARGAVQFAGRVFTQFRATR